MSFSFLLILVVITIKKKKENETSILMKIMTNYLQLVSAAYSFNFKFPSTLVSILGPVDILGSSSDAFLSFD